MSQEAAQTATTPNETMSLEVVHDVPLHISAVLGRTTMKINQLLKLTRGSVVELDKKVGDAVEVHINGRLVAKGEIVLVDNKIGITITELVKREDEEQ